MRHFIDISALMVIASLRRYGVYDMPTQSITGMDFDKTDASKPSFEALQRLLCEYPSVNKIVSANILMGTGVLHRRIGVTGRTIRKIMDRFLPESLREAIFEASWRSQDEKLRENYPEIYAEYKKMEADPATYYADTSHDVDGIDKLVRRIHEQYKQDTGHDLTYVERDAERRKSRSIESDEACLS